MVAAFILNFQNWERSCEPGLGFYRFLKDPLGWWISEPELDLRPP